jgi:anti-anti-sigma factor
VNERTILERAVLDGDFLSAHSSIRVLKESWESVMLTVDTEKSGDVAVVRCSGRLVRGEAVCTLRSAVVSEKDTRIVVLDLSEVQSVDAGGLTALVSLHHWTRNHGIQLKLVNPSHFVREMLELTHLDSVFDVSTLHDALRVLSGVGCCESMHLGRAVLSA